MTEPMVEMIDEQLPEAFFAWGGVRAVIPVSREESFDPRVSQQYGFEFEPFTLHSEETVSHISNIRTYVPFFFGANENSTKSRKRSGDSDLAANDGYDANVAVRLGNAGGVKKSKTLHDAGEGSYDYFNRTSEPSPSNLAFGALIYAPKTGQRNKRKKDFRDTGMGLGELDATTPPVSPPAASAAPAPLDDSSDKDPFGFETNSYARRTRPRTSSGPIEDTPPQLGAPTSSVPAPLPNHNITSPSTLFEYITSGQTTPAVPPAATPALAPVPSAAAPSVSADPLRTAKSPAKPIAPANTASTLAAKAAAAQMLVDQVKRAEQLLVKERDRTVAAHNAALANAQNAGVTVSNTPIVDVSTARKLQQRKDILADNPLSASAPSAAARPAASATSATNSARTTPASAPSAPARSAATSAATTSQAPSTASRHDHHGHPPHSHTSGLRKTASATGALSTHQSAADEALHIKSKLKGHTPAALAPNPASDIWNVPEEEERKRIKEFWLSLSEKERSVMIKLEKDAVLKKMKEQQRHTCSCSVCGRRRTAIEEELELLYDAYYEELERFAEKEGTLNLGLKTGMLSVADDLMKNEGKKFLEMMEKLAERRMKKQLEEEAEHDYPESDLEDEYEDETYEDEEDGMTEEQRLEEGKRMFQMFAAKMFEQRVLTAYREKVAFEKQQKLIEEEEDRARSEQQKKEKAQKKREQKKSKKKVQAEEKKVKEEEKKREEEKKKEEETARRKQEDERKRKEAVLRERERLVKEEKKRQEDEKKRREEEKALESVPEPARVEKEKSRPEKVAASEQKTLPADKSAPPKDAKKPQAPAAAPAPSPSPKPAAQKPVSAKPLAETTVAAKAAPVETKKPAQKSETFDVTDFIDPIVAQEVLGGKKKKKKQKNKKNASESTQDTYIPGLSPQPAASAKRKDSVDATSSVIPNGVAAPSQTQGSSVQWQSVQSQHAQGNSNARYQQHSSPNAAGRGGPYPMPMMQNQGRGMPQAFVPFRGPPMMGPPFMAPFFPAGFPMGAPFTGPFAMMPNGMGMMAPNQMAQPGSGSPASPATPSGIGSPNSPPFTPQSHSVDYGENISPSPRSLPPQRAEQFHKSEDDDDDMSTFLQSLPTTMKDSGGAAAPSRGIVDEAFADNLDDPEPAPKPAAARQLFKEAPAPTPLWGDYKPSWDTSSQFGSPWSESDATPLSHSGEGSPTKGRSTFLRKVNEDPVIVPSKKKAPIPPSPRGGLDMESRVRLAFEVIRRRILELPLQERVPFPFDYWAKMMCKVDSELESEVNFSIDEVMHEAEATGLISTGSVEGSSDGRYCLSVTDRDVFCFLCGVRQADTVLQPCHHVICNVCLKNNAVQPIGIIGPATYKTCPYCAKPIQRQDSTRQTATNNSVPTSAPPGLPQQPIRSSWDFETSWVPGSAADPAWAQASPVSAPLLNPVGSWDSPPSEVAHSGLGWSSLSRAQDEYPIFNQPSGPSSLGYNPSVASSSSSLSGSRNLAPANYGQQPISNGVAPNNGPPPGSSIWGSAVGGLPFFSSGS